MSSCCQSECSTAVARSGAVPWALVVSGVAAVGAEVLDYTGWGEPAWVMVCAMIAILATGLPVYKNGWAAIRRGDLSINALMSLAVTGAVLIGHWPEAAMVMFLFALAERIEAKSLGRARDAIHGLLQLAPETVMVRQPDASWQERSVTTVAVGDIVRARPGERIGLDGKVVDGYSTVNQAPITGESLPVEKAVGDTVFAGTINGFGGLEYRVTAGAQHTTLARIIHAVEQAQRVRAPTQRVIDAFARVYTPVVLVLALLVAVIPPLFMQWLWLDAVYRALVLLVIACPCALVISTPVTIMSGLTAAARMGILVKGGAFLEAGRHMKVLALDKTGTLTHGMPQQTDVRQLTDADAGQVRRLAVSLAQRSDHPVSQALVRAYDGPLDAVAAFQAIPGEGVQGTIGSVPYRLGNHRLIHASGLCSPELEEVFVALEKQGKSVVAFSNDTQVLALFAVADTVRPHSREAIAQLAALGIRTIMLTGDNAHAAQTIAREVQLADVQAGLLPLEKRDAVASFNVAPDKVGMVGDGINDAPALAQADIGFAMGAAGTDTAIETADVALMDDDLRKIPLFVRLSHATVRVLGQNIALAVGIKTLFLMLAVTGQATLWMAVFADVGASLLVVANGLRLLRFAPQTTPLAE